jgi:hypothetical protein
MSPLGASGQLCPEGPAGRKGSLRPSRPPIGLMLSVGIRGPEEPGVDKVAYPTFPWAV